MNVLVTGGAGFIGSHVCEALIDRGDRVRVLDSMVTGSHANLPSAVEVLEGDVRDADLCRASCRATDAVVHLAAFSRVAPTLTDPATVGLCTDVNVVGTLRILEAARDAGVRRFVYASSSTVYGNAPPPQHENLAPECLNAYALTKWAGEQYCLFFDRFYDLPTLSLRYFQVCGPRQQQSGPFSCLTGIFARQLAAGEPLTIHGDGQQRRDFVHVRDVAMATVSALHTPARGVPINIGTGTSYAVRELADRLSPLQVREGGRRAGDADHTRADVERAQELLGWSATIGFDEIVAEMIAA